MTKRSRDHRARNRIANAHYKKVIELGFQLTAETSLLKDPEVLKSIRLFIPMGTDKELVKKAIKENKIPYTMPQPILFSASTEPPGSSQ